MRVRNSLTADELRTFEQEGYLVLEDILSFEQDLIPVIEEYEFVLDRVARELCAAGKIKSHYSDLPFGDRFTKVAFDLGKPLAPYFDITLPPGRISKQSPCHTGPAVFSLITNDRLLDAVEAIIGPEIYSNPVQHIRIKLPRKAVEAGLDATTKWHQDASVLTRDALETDMLTVWSPLTDVTIENGCLAVLPRSHDALAEHCAADGQPSIRDGAFPRQPVPVPMKAGSLLVMHRRTIHAAFPNQTDSIRFSFDLRYQPPGQPTGRAAYPGFLARSRARPERVLADPAAWERLWTKARNRLEGTAQTWGFELWDTC